jgi:predicted GIY-YIG superfamily endonuclease
VQDYGLLMPSKAPRWLRKAKTVPRLRLDHLRPPIASLADLTIAHGSRVSRGLFSLTPAPIHSLAVWTGLALGLQAIMPPLDSPPPVASTSKANSVENPTMPPLYVCYILRSKAKGAFSNRSYIGSTPDPPRRFRQHNGAMKGGAWRTSLNGPWEMEAFVYGFPNKLSALQVRPNNWVPSTRSPLPPVRVGLGCARSFAVI